MNSILLERKFVREDTSLCTSIGVNVIYKYSHIVFLTLPPTLVSSRTHFLSKRICIDVISNTIGQIRDYAKVVVRNCDTDFKLNCGDGENTGTRTDCGLTSKEIRPHIIVEGKADLMEVQCEGSYGTNCLLSKIRPMLI